MKNPKKLTRRQKEFLDERKMDPKEFLFMEETSSEIRLWDKIAKNTLVMKKNE